MFPIIIPSTLKGDSQKIKISTLQNYTHLTNEHFHEMLVKRSNELGLISGIQLINDYANFDNLSESAKQKIVAQVEAPETIKTTKSILSIIKNLFK